MKVNNRRNSWRDDNSCLWGMTVEVRKGGVADCSNLWWAFYNILLQVKEKKERHGRESGNPSSSSELATTSATMSRSTSLLPSLVFLLKWRSGLLLSEVPSHSDIYSSKKSGKTRPFIVVKSLKSNSPQLKEHYPIKGWYPMMVALDHSPAMTWRPLPFPSLAPSMIPGRSRSCKIKDRVKERGGKGSHKSEQIKKNDLFFKYPKYKRSKSTLPYKLSVYYFYYAFKCQFLYTFLYASFLYTLPSLKCLTTVR